MAVRASIATGNWSAAATWGLVDATSYLNAENATESLLTTAYSGTRSSAFTPGAITISHIGVKLCERIGTTGTISVNLELDSDNSQVAGTEVTINVADLPAATEANLDGGWIFFKLATPVTLAAATAYQVAAKTSSATQVDLWCDGTVDNLARALITTTTGAPAAGDDLIVAGEHTGAGTGNDFTVTYDITAATDFGAASTSQVTPALAICKRGILTWGTTAATNYLMRLSGHLIVYCDGYYHQGTTATPVPRGSTAWLEFDCAADGDFRFVVRHAARVTIQGLSRTSGKNVDRCKLNTDEAAAQTTLGVDTDTGWLSGDVIGIASTTRTASQCESRTLSGDAGASSITVSSGLTNAHSGTSPTQAEVILLTRNVGVRSVSATAMTALSFAATAIVDIDWAEFYYIGSAAANGFTISTATSGTLSVINCSFHDTEALTIFTSGTTNNNWTFQNNVLYNIGTAAASTCIQISLTSGTAWVFDGNWVILANGTSTNGCLAVLDMGGQFTNNLVAGFQQSTGAAIRFWDIGIDSTTLLNISGNIAHSNAGAGVGFINATGSQPTPNCVLGSLTSWGNSGAGVELTHAGVIELRNAVLFGNTASNILVNSVVTTLILDTVTSTSFTGMTTTSGITRAGAGVLTLINCSFSVATGLHIAHTQDVNITANSSGTPAVADFLFLNTILAAATEVNGFTSTFVVLAYSKLRFQRLDQTNGNHKTVYGFGVAALDTAIFDTSPSLRVTPSSASFKVRVPIGSVNVNSGQAATPTVKVRESVAGDGTDYNGSRVRLLVLRNDALGITADTVLDTATVSSEGAFEDLTGATGAVTDNGVLEFAVDCDGTTGWVNVDSLTAIAA